MRSLARLLRVQWLLLGVCLGLVAYYWLGYAVLGRKLAALDQPLAEARKTLLELAQGNRSITGTDPASMDAGLRAVEAAVDQIQAAVELARQRVALNPELRAKLAPPFVLLDYDKRRLQVGADLRQLAQAKQVTLEPAALSGFPEFSSTLTRPWLLWAQLDAAQQIAATAIAQGPAAIRALTPLPVKLHLSPDGQTILWAQFPVRVQLVGPVEAALGFLRSLPLRENELKAMGLAEVPGKTQALLVDRFLVKNSITRLNDVELDAIISGFVSLE